MSSLLTDEDMALQCLYVDNVVTSGEVEVGRSAVFVQSELPPMFFLFIAFGIVL